MDFVLLVQLCAPMVAPETMLAIIRAESGFNPWAIGVNGGARLVRQPVTREEAIVTARWLINNGYNIDMGAGQLNSKNLPRLQMSIEDAFDPCRNITAAGSILHGNYIAAKRHTNDEQAALRAALSAYNTGTFHRGFTNGYVQRVMTHAGVNFKSQGEARPIPLNRTRASTTKPPSGQSPPESRARDGSTRNVMVFQ